MRWLAAGLLALVVSSGACTLLYPPDDYVGGVAPGRDAAAADAGSEGGADASGCVYSAAVHHIRNPDSGVEIFTLSDAEVANAAAAGYTDDRGIAFRAATQGGGSRSSVYRVANPSTKDRIYTISATEKGSLPGLGYTNDEGIAFYANGLAVPCTTAVEGFQRLGIHTLAATDAERATLRAAGWKDEGVRFYAAPP